MASTEAQSPVLPSDIPTRVTLIGTGTIGLSFAALHLVKSPNSTVTLYDTRPDLQNYIAAHLPTYLPAHFSPSSRLRIALTIEEAVSSAQIIQEQGPENIEFKRNLWPEIEKYAPASALLWTSTSGIPASAQAADMKDPSRLLVVHPFNPPHIMPLLELVPSPSTAAETIEATLKYWRALGRSPVVLKKECTGFVANRLAFALFREACSLVNAGVVGVEDLDEIVTSSMGPRWAVAGPFKAYAAGGGEKGLEGFMEKIGGTVGECWEDSDRMVKDGDVRVGGEWQGRVCEEAGRVYGEMDLGERDRKTRKVLEAVDEGE
ncbi:hypothetical protein MBLNU230_g7316t1 [Neophaeotheca triangularis]